MRYKKIIVMVICLLIVVIAMLFFVNQKTILKDPTPYANITDLDRIYAADEEIEQANKALEGNIEMATTVKGDPTLGHSIALTFDGMTEPTTMDRILDLLKKYNVKATFFVEGSNAADNKDMITKIEKSGQKIENYTFVGITHAEQMPPKTLLVDLCRTQKVIKTLTDKTPSLLKGSKMIYTEQLLKTAKACGLKSVVKTDAFLPHNQLRDDAEADVFVHTLKNGNIVSVELGTAVDIKKETGKTNDTPAINKQPGLKVLADASVESDDIVLELERVLQALKAVKYDTVFVENLPPIQSVPTVIKVSQVKQQVPVISVFKDISLMAEIKQVADAVFGLKIASAAEQTDNQALIANLREANHGRLAIEQKMIMTTDQSVIYTFGGLANEMALDDALERLKRMNVQGTFFIMEVEMKRYPSAVRKIIDSGQEIGIAIRPKPEDDFATVSASILRSQQILREQFGVETSFVKQPWEAVSDATKEAVSALHCKLIGHLVNVVQSKDQAATSPEEVMPHIFGKAVTALGRGQILYFRLDYYKNSLLAGQLMETIKKEKLDNIAYQAYDDDPKENPQNDSAYKIASLGEVLRNTAKLYQYPIDKNNVPAYLRSEYIPVKVDEQEHPFITEAAKRYIGAPLINEGDRMIGFSNKEMRRLDGTGLIHTKDPVVFLAFDDWGWDDSINKLLYVLRKHHVTGTFFVITHNILNNPNLLRAIGAGGNEIGSHSEWHRPMAIRDPKTHKQYAPQTRTEYEADLSMAYRKLESIVGDQKVDGRYTLTRFFRPPTLAVSKMGLETLFKEGYEFSVSGSYSTADYDAKNVNEMLNKLQQAIYSPKGINRGAVLVMHMSWNAHYTARALDIILTANERRADNDPLKFKVGRLSDYLTKDYSQLDKRTMHNLMPTEKEW